MTDLSLRIALRSLQIVALCALLATIRAEEPEAFAQGDPPESGDISEYFDLDDFVEEPKLTLHGSIDLTYVSFEDSRNLDDFPRDRATPLEPKLVLRYQASPEHSFLTEVELDGLAWDLELEQCSYRFSPAPETEFGVGIQYIPFGIERLYNSPARNPLVDRPSPYRHIFPGTYSDLGLFLKTARDFASGWTWVVEAAVTRSLQGPTRKDRNDPFERIEEIQPSGRIGLELPNGVSFGASALLARYDDGFGGHEELSLAGLDFSIIRGETILRVEAIRGKVGRADALGGGYDRYGWYAELYQRFPRAIPWGEALEGVLRYDDLETNDEIRDLADVRRVSVGLNWVIDEDWRLKTQVSISHEDGESVANDGRFIQLEYHF